MSEEFTENPEILKKAERMLEESMGTRKEETDEETKNRWAETLKERDKAQKTISKHAREHGYPSDEECDKDFFGDKFDEYEKKKGD